MSTDPIHDKLVNDCLLELSPLGLVWCNDTPGLGFDRNGTPRQYGLAGSSDILGVINARAIAVECKTGRSSLSTKQRRFRDAFQRAGGVFVEARSVSDLAPIKALAA